ncbi:MAG: hypothetical protein CME43_01365 [Haliea sp.]|uniref:hypothetical protein n=1 Tax=Haliea sp. TaxID=1932666 RepID=UPI000C5F9ADB|nr:hypothetical protein [Haliea sp.]MBM68112.1 hypothetical protein [Haliea sp.]|tara:strand:+ start:6262 stop:7791 length:1530 start_codon:yes stop_codon:yes gene_type:complete
MAAKPVYYSVAPEASAQLSLLIKDTGFTAKLRDFLLILIDACQDAEHRRISRQDFVQRLHRANHAASAGLIGKRFKELSEIGVLKETDCYLAGKACRIVELTSLQPVLAHFGNADRQTLIPSHRPSRQQLTLAIDQLEMEGSFLSLSEDVPPRIESLFCILDAGMKLSGRDKRKDIQCKYQFYEDDWIEIRTSTQTREGSDVAYLSDERAMRALNGILLDQLESRFGSLDRLSVTDLGIKDEYFFFDLYDLCRRMGLRPNDQNRRIVREMLARLRDTEFKVDASQSPYFREAFTFGAETAHYRYITEFYAKKDYQHDVQGRRLVSSDRYYMVKFHTAILANLVSGGRSFISHDGLMSERSGLAHRLNNWAKAVIGVRPKPTSRPFTYTLDEFGERVIPSARLDNFERDFLNLIRRQCNEVDEQGEPHHAEATPGWREEGTNVGWLYGYYYKIEWDEDKIQEHRRMRRRRPRTTKLYPLITIWRDTRDHFVGDNSAHNKALRRQAAALAS